MRLFVHRGTWATRLGNKWHGIGCCNRCRSESMQLKYHASLDAYKCKPGGKSPHSQTIQHLMYASLHGKIMTKGAHLLPKTSRKLCLAPLSKGQAPVECRRFSYISIVVMFLAIMRQCITKKPTIANAKAASITKARNKIAGLQVT